MVSKQEKADYEVDVQGLIIAPGYIDLQINGGFGIDFSIEANQVKQVASRLPQYGVTSFLPTLVSLKKEQYPSLLPHLQPCQGGAKGSNILGIHLEGPFLILINMELMILITLLLFKNRSKAIMET